MDIAGKVIWITGASSGIGRSLAIELAGRGARIALSSRNYETLEEVSRGINAGGGSALSIACDVQDTESLRSALAEINRKLGVLDILIANAGTHIETWPEVKFEAAEYLKLMDINFGGVIRSIEVVLSEMLSRGKGTIAGVTSLAGYRGLPQAAAYGASKAAINHFLESIRFHLRPKGIKVVSIAPGFVKTPLTDKNTFEMPFRISAERCAKIIAQGLEREKDFITFPLQFSTFMNFMRCIPFAIYDRLVTFQWKKILAKKR
jgi:short-subunit dehydrogenase